MLTICLAALCDAALSRSSGAFMGFAFMALITLYATLLCGLVQLAFPGIPLVVIHTLQVSLAPLCSTLALVFTGRWLNVKSEDEKIGKIIGAGTATMGALTVLLAILALRAQNADIERLLVPSAATCLITIVLTGICAWKAIKLGDRLAIWLAPAAILLTVTIGGLYSEAANPGQLTILQICATALCAVLYLLMIAYLSIARTRQAKRLERLAGLHLGADPTTGLPTGSALIAKVEDAFWHSTRHNVASNVVCMHLHNLYDLAEVAGHGVENQIALAMSARIRRAVGFRCVVGLYHARCFIAVIQAPNRSSDAQIASFVQRLRYLISKPVQVIGHKRTQHEFNPDWGIAVVSASGERLDSTSVLRQAEREAMQDTQTIAKVQLGTRLKT